MKRLIIYQLLIFIIVSVACEPTNTRKNPTIKNKYTQSKQVPENKKIVISVAKFEDRSIGTKLYSPWCQGIPDMIMETLGAIPYYKIISREYVIDKVLKEQSFQLLGVTEPENAVKLGKILNANYMVIGSFSVFKDTLQINAKVLSVETGQIAHQTSATGYLNEFYILQNKIAINITEGMNLQIDENAKQTLITKYDTKDVQASLANYQGEEKLEKAIILEKQAKLTKDSESKKLAQQIKEEAKQDFKKALEYDSAYTKAKKNLSKLMQAVPMTL